jgi:large subunit ribosomal protein L13
MAKIIVDGKDAILGRLGSFVAKELLKGNSVDVINSEEVIISGSKEFVVKKIQLKRDMGRGSSLKGPKYIRQADRLLKRMIRGMLPWDRAKGREAHKRLRCYIGEGEVKKEDQEVKKMDHKRPIRYSTIKEVARALK